MLKLSAQGNGVAQDGDPPSKHGFCVCKKCALKKAIAKNYKAIKKVFSYMHILFVFVPGDSFAEVKECEAANDCAQGVCTPIK